MKIPEVFFESQNNLLDYLIAPLVSVQLFITILIYFIIVRKRIAIDYKLYIYFLAAFILFLAGRIFQIFLPPLQSQIIMYVRMALLFGVGIPSLLVASVKPLRNKKDKIFYIAPYVVGAIVSITYVFLMILNKKDIIFSNDFFSFIEIENPRNWAHRVQVLGAILLLVLPCSLFIIKELKGEKNTKQIAFLLGALIFGSTLAIGLGSTPRRFNLYYIGSIASGLFWLWAVFQDIKDMKGKVGLLKDELQLIIRSGVKGKEKEVTVLLNSLEEFSHGNLDLYKLRIREILNMLTDTSIEAGGDSKSLIQRNTTLNKAIESSIDTQEIRHIISKEAKEYSKILTEIPLQNNDKLIEQALKHVHDNYSEDLSIDKIAELVGVSRTHFMREFKKRTGQTFTQYQTSLRIEEAKKLLSNNSVSDTSFRVGYNNPNYFSTVFKKHVGLSPVEYQQQNL